MASKINSSGFSMAAVCSVFRDQVGVEHACLGVDVQSARPAPVGKRFGIDEGAHHDLSVASELLLSSLGFHEPYVERSGELIAVGHDPADGVVIFDLVPDHAQYLDRVGFQGDSFPEGLMA